jgi:TolB protein
MGVAWSPDGTRIATTLNPPLPSLDGDLLLLNADGTHPVKLTGDPANELAPNWSPDGERIGFVSTQDGTNWNAFMINVDGSGLATLPDGRYGPEADWIW